MFTFLGIVATASSSHQRALEGGKTCFQAVPMLGPHLYVPNSNEICELKDFFFYIVLKTNMALLS